MQIMIVYNLIHHIFSVVCFIEKLNPFLSLFYTHNKNTKDSLLTADPFLVCTHLQKTNNISEKHMCRQYGDKTFSISDSDLIQYLVFSNVSLVYSPINQRYRKPMTSFKNSQPSECSYLQFILHNVKINDYIFQG